MEAEDLFVREFLGIRTDEVTRQTANWIRSKQRADGTWGNYYGAPGDLSTTLEAYVALRLAGDPADAPHMAARRAVRARRGGARALAGVHEDVARAVRAVVVGRPAGDAARADLPAAVVPAEHLRLRLLGAADGRRARRRRGATGRRVRSPSTDRRAPHRRAARDALPASRASGARRSCSSTARCTSTNGGRSDALRRRALAKRSAGSSTARSTTAAGAASSRRGSGRWSRCHCAGYALDHPVMRAGFAGLDRFTIVEDDMAPARGVPVAGVGHGARGDRAARRRPRRSNDASLERAKHWLACRGGVAPRRLGRPAARTSRPAACRSSSRTTSTPTSTTPQRWCSRCAAPAHDPS